MKPTRLSIGVLVLVACVLMTSRTARASAPANDNACNTGSWTNGNNSGTGFQPWTLAGGNDGFAGFFLGSSVDTGPGCNNSNAGSGGIINGGCGNSWAIYANSNLTASATRLFTSANGTNALQVGQSFSIDMVNGFVTTSSQVGFSLQNSSSVNLWQFYFTGGGSQYQISNNSTVTNTTVGYTTSGLHVVFTLTSPTNYSAAVAINGSSTTNIFTGQVTAPISGAAITNVRLFNNNAGAGCAYNLYFNNMAVSCPDAVTVSAPSNVTVCAGNPASFTVTTTGDSPTYQWLKNGSNLSNGGSVSGANISTLTLTNVQPTDSGASFRCAVTDACGNNTNSAPATLTVNALPSITPGTPTNQSACVGTMATFTVNATGTGLAYQWLLSTNAGASFANISGATTNSYTTPAATSTNDNYEYEVAVSGVCSPPVTSQVATLTVVNNTAIQTQPTNVTACAASPVTFTVGATGVNAYQWLSNNSPLSNGGNVSGATNATLVLASVALVDNGTAYNCVLTGCGNVQISSATATLAVVASPVISVQPAPQTLCGSGTVSFSVTATNATGYQWLENNASLSNGGSILGATTATLTLLGANTNNNGAVFACLLAGTAPCAPLLSGSGTLTVNTPVFINSQPLGQTNCSGSPAAFSVSATGTALSYQWQKNGGSITNGGTISGATTPTLALSTIQPADSGAIFQCVVSGAATCPPMTSTGAMLIVNSSASITSQAASQIVCSNATAIFTNTASGTAPVFYAWRNRNPNLGWGAGNAWLLIPQNGSCNISNGFYIGDSTHLTNNNGCGSVSPGINSNTSAFALYANNGDSSAAVRNFGALAVGQSVSFDYQNPEFLVNNGANVTIAKIGLQDAVGTPRFEFYFRGGDGQYSINDANAQINSSGIPYQSGGLHCVLTLTGANTYNLTVSVLGTNQVYTFTGRTLTGTPGNPISQVKAYLQNFDTTGGACEDFFFNNIVAGAFEDHSYNYTGGACSGTTWVNGSNLGFGPLTNGPTGTGAAISGATTNILTITNAQPGDNSTYDMVAWNAACPGQTISTPATLTVTTVASAGFILGPQNVCAGEVGVGYSILSVGGATSYGWTLPPGAVITYGTTNSAGPSSITVTFGSASGNVTVTPINGGCAGTPASLPVTVTSTVGPAGPISGATLVCAGQNGVEYSIAPVSNATEYVWSVPPGASFGQEATNIFVDFGSIQGNVSVTPMNGNCTGTSASLPVTVNYTSCLISGPTNVCAGSSQGYTGPTGSALTYAWSINSVPGSTASISGPANQQAVSVNVDGANSFTLTLTVGSTNGCANSICQQTVTVNPLPTCSITGPGTICPLSISNSYSATAGMTAYNWTANGATIMGAANQQTVYVAAGPSGSFTLAVSITGTNGCVSSCTNLVTTFSTPPSVTTPSNQTACAGNSAVFTANAGGNGPFTYMWRKRGAGWGAGGWQLSTTATNAALGGFFVGTSTANAFNDVGNHDIDSTNGAAWGMYANGGFQTTAVRPFNGTLAPGQTFRVDVDNGFIDSPTNLPGGLLTNEVGFALSAAGTDRFVFYFAGGDSQYRIADNSGTTNSTGVPFTGDGLHIAFTLTSPDTYSVSIITAVGGVQPTNTVTIIGTLAGAPGSSIDRARLFDINAGAGTVNNAYFNNLSFDCHDDNAGNYTSATWTNASDLGNAPLANGLTANGSTISGANTSTMTISNTQPNDAGTYDVCASDACGLITNSNPATLTINPTPSTVISAPSTVCGGSTGNTASVPVTAGASYAWTITGNGTITANSGTHSITFSAGAAGSIGLGVTATLGCSSSNSATVTVTTNITAITSQPVSSTNCAGTVASFTVSAGSAIGYQWLKGGSTLNNGGDVSGATTATLTINPASSGDAANYKCIVFGACNSITSSVASLTVPPLPTASVSGGATICQGSSTMIQAALTGTAPWNVTWSDGNVQSGVGVSPAIRTVNPSTNTTYTVTAVSDANCSGTSSGNAAITVNPTPTGPTPGSNSPINEGQTLNLTASLVTNATYGWSGPNAFASSTQNPSITNATISDSGTYYVAVTVNGCTSPSNSTFVTVSPFRIIAVTLQSNNVLVTWESGGGKTNQVQSANAGANGGYNSTNTFLNLGPQIILPGSSEVITNYLDAGGGTNLPARFYRIRLVP